MLTMQLLGGFTLTHDGEPIPGLTRPRGKSLLAYLLLHHATPQDRAHLAYTFWPETSDSQARTNLRRELHQLRRLSPLIAASIQSDGQSVHCRLPAESTIDVTEFINLLAMAEQTTDLVTRRTHYQAAIDCYHGDLLPGLYDNWVLAKREELRQRLFEALAHAVTVDARPKLLLLNDLQWCDQETLEWLRFLLRFAPAAPLLLLGTVRTEEIANDHPPARIQARTTGEQAIDHRRATAVQRHGNG